MPEIRQSGETRFIADRMLGTLTRYLRFMGYDTRSANELKPGNSREEPELLELAGREDRILLTRCSICNSELQDATPREIEGADYAPWDRNDLHFYWCPHCGKLYWNGSHGRRLLERIVRGELPREERVLK